MEVFQILISGISQGCVYGLIAMGFVLIYKATEMVNFAQGELMMLGAYFAYTFINILGMDYLTGFIATVVSMAIVGVVLERGILRPMIGEPPFAVLMITIGLGFILRAFVGAVWGTETKTLSNPFTGNVARFGELSIGYENIAIIVGTLILCVSVFVFFRFTRLGIAMQAASQNQLAAYYVGIPVKKIYSIVWALSAALAAMAGVLVAPVSLLEPVMGFIGIKAFCAAIVGGFGSLPGAILGGLIVGIAEQFANLYLPPGLAATTAYVILLVMLLVRPQGLFATLQQKKV